jgi:hypothetical protein
VSHTDVWVKSVPGRTKVLRLEYSQHVENGTTKRKGRKNSKREYWRGFKKPNHVEYFVDYGFLL